MEFLIRFTTFNILPTLFEIALVGVILWNLYDWRFTAVTLGVIAGYIVFSVVAVGMAHQVRAPHERCRHRGQRQGDRQPAELRDGEVLRQRGARGAPLRCRPPALRDGRHPLQPHPVAAQHRPGRDHLGRPGLGHGDGGLRRRRRHHDAGRLRGGERLPDPALHAAQHAGLRLSRDPQCAGEHGEDVRPARRPGRDRRQAGRAGARR